MYLVYLIEIKDSEFAGVQRDKTMVDKLMYIPNEEQNSFYCRLHLEIFRHLTY